MFTTSCDHRILPVLVIAVNYVHHVSLCSLMTMIIILLALCGGLVGLTLALVIYRVQPSTTGPNLELFPCAISGPPCVNYCNP